jgi:hypothetical protein
MLLLTIPLLGQNVFASDWGLHVKGGASATWWFTSDDDDDEAHTGHAIDYEAEPASSWLAEVIIRHGNRDLFSLNELFGVSATGPFGTAPRQSEVIERTESPITALEDYLVFLQLFGLLSPEASGLADFLAGLRLDYRRATFYGRGVAVEQALFASRESGLVPLNVGDEFQLRAEFEDWYLTLLRFVPQNRDLRIGVYRSVLEKPHETMEWIGGDEGALVVETRLSGVGVFFQAVSRSWDFLFRVGGVDFEPLGDLEDLQAYGGKGSFSMLMEFGWNPNLVLAGPPADGSYTLPRLVVRPALGFQFRADYLSPEDPEANSAEGELSMDILTDLGVQVAWRF